MTEQTIDNGGPAFPQDLQGRRGDNPEYQGMTLRDWFAGQMMSAMVSASNDTAIVPKDESGEYAHHNSWPAVSERHGEIKELARISYDIADAMLKARNAGRGKQTTGKDL